MFRRKFIFITGGSIFVSIFGQSVPKSKLKYIMKNIEKKFMEQFNLKRGEMFLVADPGVQRLYLIKSGTILKEYRISTSKYGLGSESGSITKSVEKYFSPEFRNRLDKVIVFEQLSRKTIVKIVKKKINEFKEQLKAKKIKLSLSVECYSLIADEGYSNLFGAREIGRVIQDMVKNYFVDEVLFGELSSGGKVIGEVKKGKIAFRVEK